jgi:PTH1 family peptidyl-tRNA hydrolase
VKPIFSRAWFKAPDPLNNPTLPTKLIVGLGNPGRDYEGTRHNAGFQLIDSLSRSYQISVTKSSGRALIGDGMVFGVRIYLMKPQTFMNLSGEALAAFLRNKPLEPVDILIATDDIHLDIGRIRIRQTGSDGGHNGLKSVVAHLKTKDYPRIRIGVGEPGESGHQIDYVLGRFSRAEQKILDETIERAGTAVDTWIKEGVEAAMNGFNG